MSSFYFNSFHHHSNAITLSDDTGRRSDDLRTTDRWWNSRSLEISHFTYLRFGGLRAVPCQRRRVAHLGFSRWVSHESFFWYQLSWSNDCFSRQLWRQLQIDVCISLSSNIRLVSVIKYDSYNNEVLMSGLSSWFKVNPWLSHLLNVCHQQLSIDDLMWLDVEDVVSEPQSKCIFSSTLQHLNLLLEQTKTFLVCFRVDCLIWKDLEVCT